MNPELAKSALSMAHAIQVEANEYWLPPVEVLPSSREAVVPSVLFKNARRSYLTKVTHQINISYEHACFDACAVMIRRLVESLIIETFDAKGLASEIKGADDNFLPLSQLLSKVEAHADWHLSRNAKNALKRFKNVGDLSAHDRRYTATRHDIEELILDIRVVTQELLTVANLR